MEKEKYYKGYKYEVIKDDRYCLWDLIEHEFFQTFGVQWDIRFNVADEYNGEDVFKDFVRTLKDNGYALDDVIYIIDDKHYPSNKIIFFVLKDKAREFLRMKRITKHREDKIKTMLWEYSASCADVLKGNVYYYNIYDEGGEVIDSAGGFVGGGGVKYAVEMIEKYIDSKIKGGE